MIVSTPYDTCSTTRSECRVRKNADAASARRRTRSTSSACGQRLSAVHQDVQDIVALSLSHTAFLGAPCEGPPHCKFICPSLALFIQVVY